MQLQTLGGLVLHGSGFSRSKPLLLLAYLGLEGPRDRRHLAELFWPDAQDPLNSLRVTLTQLRAAAPGILQETAAGLSSTLEVDAVQLLTALEASDPQVLERYHGPFLAGCHLSAPGSELEEWIWSTRELLAGRMQEALLRQAEAAAAEGGFEAAARTAEKALALAGLPGPDRLERFYRVLLAGRSAGAEQLRLEAATYGTDLLLTEQQARQQLTAGGAAPPHNLPARLNSFIGRDPELVDLLRLLAEPDTRLVTLAGPGGAGKSRLALEAARLVWREGRFRDGVYFVPLASLSEPALIPGAIAAALGRSPQQADSSEDWWCDLLSSQVLLVLDNFEQLLPGAPLLAELLSGCAQLKLLVTSRQRLHLEAEQAYLLEGLSYPPVQAPSGSQATADQAAWHDSLLLFEERARRSQPDFRLTEADLPPALAICRLTRGLPLGLELAAAWVRLLPVADIARELEHDLDFLTATGSDRQGRQVSLRATFEHSWRLLDLREQRALRQLSVFPGSFSRDAAAQVADAGITLLAALVDKSLLQVSAAGRFERHPLLRQFTQEKLLAEPREAALAWARYGAYFTALAAQAEEGLKGAGQVLWLERLEAEHDNLRALLLRGSLPGATAAEAVQALQVSAALWQFWLIHGHLTEGRSWYDRLLAAALPAAAADRARALSGAGVLAFAQDDHAASHAYHAEALELREQAGLELAAARSLYNLGSIAAAQDDLVAAQPFFERSLQVFREHGDAWAVAMALTNVAMLALQLGDLPQARRLHEESLQHRRELGDLHGTSGALRNLASVLLEQGDCRSARSLLLEALRISDELGDLAGLAASFAALAALDAADGRPARAARRWAAAGNLTEGLGKAAARVERDGYAPQLAAARALLGEAGFQAAWREGKLAPPAQVVASLLAEEGVP
jgi:predicted ATPase